MLSLKAFLLLITLSLTRTDNVPNLPKSNPALIFRLTRDGLDLIAQAIQSVLPSLVLNATVPDFNLAISYTKIDLKNFIIRQFSDPKIVYTLVPANKLSIDLITGPIEVTADWFAEKPTFWSTQKDKGTLKLRTNEFRTNVAGEIGNTFDNGLPSLVSQSCTAQLGTANLNIKNATQSFFIDIMQTFSLVLKPVLQSQLCSVIKSILVKDVNQRLQMLPDVLKFHSQVGVKFLMQPLVTNEYIEMTVKAMINANRTG